MDFSKLLGLMNYKVSAGSLASIASIASLSGNLVSYYMQENQGNMALRKTVALRH
jgi:hypothetical protein